MKRKIFVAALIASSSTCFAQAPAAPEKMSPTLRFDVKTKQSVGDPTVSPPSYREVSWLIQAAASTANKLEIVSSKMNEVNKRGSEWLSRNNVHNAQWPDTGCEYPPDNPRACDGWTNEANVLNAEKQKMVSEFEYLANVHKTLQAHQAIVFKRIQFNAFFEMYTSWEHRVVGCTLMQAEAAQMCLKSAWEQRP